MDQRLNPYTPGSGIKPLKLAGRDGDLEAFGVLLERLASGQPERSLIYSGLRGVGKTVLLQEFETLAREAGWVCNDVEEVGSGDFRQTFAELAYQMLLSMSRRERMRARATTALGVLKAFSVGVPGGFTAKLDVEAASGTADSGDPERDLAVLLVEVGQVAQSGGTGAVFILDEMQALDATALAAVCMSMNRVGQRGLPVALVGAGLPPLPRLLRAAKPYAERMFAYHELDRLSDAEARMALVAPAALREVEYEAPAVELVLEASAGYPHFIQEYGRVLWNEVDSSPITATSRAHRRSSRRRSAGASSRIASRWPPTPSSATWWRWPISGMGRCGRLMSRFGRGTRIGGALLCCGRVCCGRTWFTARGAGLLTLRCRCSRVAEKRRFEAPPGRRKAGRIHPGSQR
jgi:hypothetical protein